MPGYASKYRRLAPPLPPAESLPFPSNLVRECTECNIRKGCRAPVPGENITPCDIVLVGQNPGFNEDQEGRPFIGQAGQYLDSLLFQSGIPRPTVAILNLVKCLTPGNRVPTPAEIKACSKWLDLELSVINPRIIVAMGAPAITRFLGAGAGTVEHLHGKPVEVDGRIILPVYHPAAALRNTTLLRQCSDDFQVLRGLAKGHDISEYHVRDEYPEPDYKVADGPEAMAMLKSLAETVGTFAIDTETSHGKLWSAQISVRPGTSWFVPLNGIDRLDLSGWKATAIMHNYLFDVQYVKVADDRFLDTMVMAYLCVARDTPILRSDLSWCRADDVRIGDNLVGFDEDIARTDKKHSNRGGSVATMTTAGGYARRKLHNAVVENTFVYKAFCYDVETSDGRHVICTGNHKWLVYSTGHHELKWLTVKEIAERMGKTRRVANRICNPSSYVIRSLVPRPWEFLDTNDGGWLAGIVDGEGYIGPPSGNGACLYIAQNLGAVHSRVMRLLQELGYTPSSNLYSDRSKLSRKNRTYTIGVSGMANILRLFGQIRPSRLARDFWDGLSFPQDQQSPTIVSVTPVGQREVVAIKTSTNTYIANGLASHNCGQPQGLKELASRLCGVKMVNYSEVTRPGQQELTLEYLRKASGMEWPDPPAIEETKWDNRQGKLVTKAKKPWHISRKISKILDDFAANSEVDPYERWKSIPDEERSVVENKLGAMPESSLADIPFEQAVQYANRDSDVTLRVYYKLRRMIDDLGLNYVLKMDTDILPMVYSMMQNGMAVDLEHYRKLSEDYDIRMRVKAAELAGMVGHPFNPASSLQVATVVYSELGFKPTKTTATGLISTDDAELKKTGHPVAKGIIQYRGLLKLKSTYADNLIRSAHPDENGIPRVHTVLTTTRVETGRLSSKKDDNGEGANLQNIPTRNKEAKAIKNGFIAPDGKVLIEGDYSQVEMVTLSHLSGCKRLIELFLRGGDPHTEMAARIFDVSIEEASKSKYRYPVKRLNFGIAYLIGPQGLANQIQEYIADLEMEGEPVDIEPWDEPTCEKFIADWYKLNPEVKDFQMSKASEARRFGYVTDLFGRIRFIPEVSCPIRSIQEAGLRQAANFPVTATAQGIIKGAMGELWRGLPKTEWASHVRFLMQIHDSLVIEVDDNEDIYKPYLRWMRDIMCNTVKLRVPVKVDFKLGRRWGDMSKVKLD